MKIEKIIELPADIQYLVSESQVDGFRFLKRLVDEFNSGINRFDNLGEVLLAVREQDKLIAIGGINNDNGVARLRRFYVSKRYRRTGLGSRLLKELEQTAIKSFSEIVLFTDTSDAGKFYQSCGYTWVEERGISHRKNLHKNCLL